MAFFMVGFVVGFMCAGIMISIWDKWFDVEGDKWEEQI